MFQIPAPFPDLSPTEYMFQLLMTKLHKDAIDQDITKESFGEFSQHVRKTIKEFPVDIVDRATDWMIKRVNKILANGGELRKY